MYNSGHVCIIYSQGWWVYQFLFWSLSNLLYYTQYLHHKHTTSKLILMRRMSFWINFCVFNIYKLWEFMNITYSWVKMLYFYSYSTWIHLLANKIICFIPYLELSYEFNTDCVIYYYVQYTPSVLVKRCFFFIFLY